MLCMYTDTFVSPQLTFQTPCFICRTRRCCSVTQRIPVMVRVCPPLMVHFFTYDHHSHQKRPRIAQLRISSPFIPPSQLVVHPVYSLVCRIVASASAVRALLPISLRLQGRASFRCFTSSITNEERKLCGNCLRNMVVYISHRYIVTDEGSSSRKNTKYEDGLYHIRKLPQSK